MNDATMTKAERNADFLDGVIRQAKAMAVRYAEQADAILEADPAGSAKLSAAWNRVTRRGMAAVMLDEKLDRQAATEAADAVRKAGQTREPAWQARRKDILRIFRMDPEGLDVVAEEELDGLLCDMANDDELVDDTLHENVANICRRLGWDWPENLPKAPAPKASLTALMDELEEGGELREFAVLANMDRFGGALGVDIAPSVADAGRRMAAALKAKPRPRRRPSANSRPPAPPSSPSPAPRRRTTAERAPSPPFVMVGLDPTTHEHRAQRRSAPHGPPPGRASARLQFRTHGDHGWSGRARP